MKDYITKRINWKVVIISGILFVLFIAVVLPNVSAYTEEVVGGLGSPDTSFFYSGADLYRIAESYGEDGRSNYVLLRWTFDVVWPLVYLFFLFSLSVQLSKSFRSNWLKQIHWIPILATVFDFLENIFITIVMVMFPVKILWLGNIAAISTLAKWVLLYASFALISVLLLVHIIRWILAKSQLYLILLPAIIIGVLAMHSNDVPIIIWSQNIFGFILAVLLIYLILKKPEIIENKFTIPISIVLLLLTFFDSGFEGVHRWVAVGPIRLYIASIVVPILIIGIWRISKKTNGWISLIISIGVSLLLALQPDASQTTAFIIPMAIILFNNIKNNSVRYSVLGVFFLITIFSWIYLDTLPPVAYVEDILKMVAEMGIVWFAIGIASLVILPFPFILFPPQNAKLLSRCLGLYFIVVLLSTRVGNFPIPLMGYGISPILGYSIAIAWLINAKSHLLKVFTS